MKLWGGRFAKDIDSLVQAFNASLPFDHRLFEEDINGSIAWAKGLVGANVLKPSEAEIIDSGLEQVRGEFRFLVVTLALVFLMRISVLGSMDME